MQRLLRCLMLATLIVLAPAARATFHLFAIDEIYTNSDGTIQYMVLFDQFADFQDQLAGHGLLATSSARTNTFVFPNNLHNSATTGKRVLIATQGFAALNIVAPDYTVPNGFFPLANANVNYAGADQWSYGMLPTDGVNALFKNGMVGPNVATNFAGASASVVPNVPVLNYQGLWWNPAESMWGVNFAHQGDQVFATWYTYDTSGNAYWLSMLASRTSATSNVYSGTINSNVGSPFSNYTGNSPAVAVGAGILTFSDANNGTFDYTITSAGGATNVHQIKAITRFDLGGAQPTCTYASAPNLAAATNYQDLWWFPAESGWGVNFAHQGNQVFATWYTYDAKVVGNNAPLWLSALMQRQGTSNVFTGPLTRTSGPRFDNYKTSDVVQPIPMVGTATVTFTDGNNASFHYVTNGAGSLPIVDQTKPITRFLFAATGGTPCQ